jgi:hypothetical protein
MKHQAKYHKRRGTMFDTKLITQVAFSILGFIFALRLYSTCVEYPLFPFQPESASWSFKWLMTTVYDFYTLSACLCLVIVSSEPNVWIAIGWVVAINLLGSPFACLWVILSLRTRNKIALTPPTTDIVFSPVARQADRNTDYL